MTEARVPSWIRSLGNMTRSGRVSIQRPTSCQHPPAPILCLVRCGRYGSTAWRAPGRCLGSAWYDRICVCIVSTGARDACQDTTYSAAGFSSLPSVSWANKCSLLCADVSCLPPPISQTTATTFHNTPWTCPGVGCTSPKYLSTYDSSRHSGGYQPKIWTFHLSPT